MTKYIDLETQDSISSTVDLQYPGRELTDFTFNYTGDNLTSVVLSDGRIISLVYSGDNLSSITCDNLLFTLGYTSNNISSIDVTNT